MYIKRKIITNEWGEEINDNFFSKAAKKIRKLSKEQIDEFWAKSGWVDSEHGKNKSLPDWRLENIKNKEKFAKASLIYLFQEFPKKEFIKWVEGIKV